MQEDLKNQIEKTKRIAELSLKKYNLLRQLERYEFILPGKSEFGISHLKIDGFHSTDTAPSASGMKREVMYPPPVRIDFSSENGEKIRIIMVEDLLQQITVVDKELDNEK